MMFESYCAVIYKYILDAEVNLLMEFKLDSLKFIADMSVMDLQMYMMRIADKFEEKNKEREKQGTKNNFAKSLIAIRDILNYMTGNF